MEINPGMGKSTGHQKAKRLALAGGNKFAIFEDEKASFHHAVEYQGTGLSAGLGSLAGDKLGTDRLIFKTAIMGCCHSIGSGGVQGTDA